MKRTALILFLILLCVTSAQAEVARLSSGTGDSAYASHLLSHIGETGCRISGNYLKVRKSPGSSQIVGHAEQADLVRLLSVSGTWAQIQVVYSAPTSPDSWDGMSGYVDSAYLECPCSQGEYNRGTVHRGSAGTITGNGVRLLEVAKEGARTLNRLGHGAQVTAWGTTGSYTRVELPSGQNGFVLSQYLALGQSGASIPRVTAAPAQAQSQTVGTDSLFRVRSGRLRVRQTPGGTILGLIGTRDRFVLLNTQDGWGRIQVTQAADSASYVGLTGWVDMSYLTAQSQSSTQANTQTQMAAWQRLYLEWVTSSGWENQMSGMSSGGYSLIYVDGDNVPELVIQTDVEASGCIILTCGSGHVEALQTARLHFSYLERENRLLNDDGNMGVYYDRVYTIQNGRWVELAAGEYSGQDVTWQGGQAMNAAFLWNGMPVTRTEYYRLLGQIYDVNRAREPQVTGRQIRQVLGL